MTNKLPINFVQLPDKMSKIVGISSGIVVGIFVSSFVLAGLAFYLSIKYRQDMVTMGGISAMIPALFALVIGGVVAKTSNKPNKRSKRVQRFKDQGDAVCYDKSIRGANYQILDCTKCEHDRNSQKAVCKSYPDSVFDMKGTWDISCDMISTSVVFGPKKTDGSGWDGIVTPPVKSSGICFDNLNIPKVNMTADLKTYISVIHGACSQYQDIPTPSPVTFNKDKTQFTTIIEKKTFTFEKRKEYNFQGTWHLYCPSDFEFTQLYGTMTVSKDNKVSIEYIKPLPPMACQPPNIPSYSISYDAKKKKYKGIELISDTRFKGSWDDLEINQFVAIKQTTPEGRWDIICPLDNRIYGSMTLQLNKIQSPPSWEGIFVKDLVEGIPCSFRCNADKCEQADGNKVAISGNVFISGQSLINSQYIKWLNPERTKFQSSWSKSIVGNRRSKLIAQKK